MDENIGKHFIEGSSFGFANYRGVIEKETDKTFTVRPRGSLYARRVSKGSGGYVLLPADADVDAACKRYSDVIRSFNDKIRAAESELRDLKQRRNLEAMDALAARSKDRSEP